MRIVLAGPRQAVGQRRTAANRNQHPPPRRQPEDDYLLVDESGNAINKTVLENVALPVEITGRVRKLGDWRILYAPASNIRRIQ